MTMKTRILMNVLVGLLVVPLMAVYAHGASLTDAQVKRFVASMEEVQQLFDEYDDLHEMDDDFDDFDGEIDMTFPENPMSDAIAEMRGHAVYNRLQGVVRKHGFSNVEQWAGTGDKVMMAFYSLLMEEAHPEAVAEMQAALREIDDNPYMGEAQKQEMRKMMESAMSHMSHLMDAPAADKAVVRPHMSELRRVLEEQDMD